MADDLGEDWWVSDSEEHLPEARLESERNDVIAESDLGTELRNEGSIAESQIVQKGRLIKIPCKRKSLQNNENKKKKRKTITEELAVNPPQAAAAGDLIEEIQKCFYGKLTTVQLDAISLQESNFLSAHALTQPTSDYLNTVISDWEYLIKSSSSVKGAPLMIVLCRSAIRAVQLLRDITKFKGKTAKFAKLFAKHKKMKKQAQFLSENVVHIGVGTPQRVHMLINSGALKLDNLTHIILDWTGRDEKLKRMIDIPENKAQLMELLQIHLIPTVKSADRSQKTVKIGLL